MKQKMNYVFDIDGTLTPSRQQIDPEFKWFFLNWMEGKNVYFITGSDKYKTIEQIGEEIWLKATRCYQSCGNAVYENGKLIFEREFPLSDELNETLLELLDKSKWDERFSNHIEPRLGLVNFSTIGRDCNYGARLRYKEWDDIHKEREEFCRIIEERFPDLEATVGGEISIDIHPKGKNKAQILDDLKGDIEFFGDKCGVGGNDYPIVQRLAQDRLNKKSDRRYIVHNVFSWENTYNVLKRY